MQNHSFTDHIEEKIEDKKVEQVIQDSLEDYTLRYAPQRFRVWSPSVIALSALGGIAYLADFSIGASIGIAYGTTNALLAILCAALLIFITALPLAYYAARYNIDLDLISRSAGFGYLGSVITSIIFASFTFIFFALEGAIMAQGLWVGLSIPLWLGYLISTFMVIPLVVYGMKALTKMQVWTTPIWLLLMVVPVAYLMLKQPELVYSWRNFQGQAGYQTVDFAAIMLGAGVVLALIAQIGEQIDYLRFMPNKTPENTKQWWFAVISAGPGWVILGAIKQIIGAFLGFYLLVQFPAVNQTEPVQQFVSTFEFMMNPWLAMCFAVILVVISQIKINVSNAYSGSLAWTSAYARCRKRYPGRIIFVLINLACALALMEMDMFSFLHKILSFYANCAIAWISVVATDIVINKYLLKLSPKIPEYRRDMIYNFNPVGLIAFGLATTLSIAAYFGLFGAVLASYSPLIALSIAVCCTPLLCWITKGKYYIKQHDDGIATARYDAQGNANKQLYCCAVCQQHYERPDVMYCQKQQAILCSLCKTMQI
ncbi:purine-cytosine permease family protein [Acinetobacter larvae]|uniref:Allantoin permease n=1 Tax=Acinetobacter larvae TaxID=1789224 RepID=A0A1B2LZ23_9GAMM|nr:allantoin permease [Acinetobacter larvae]AOA58149.1 allantoin permease [Acinetobacter larvae]